MNHKLHRGFEVAGKLFVADASIKDPRVGIYQMPGCHFIGAFGLDALDSSGDGFWSNIDVGADPELLKQLEPEAQYALQRHVRLRAYWHRA